MTKPRIYDREALLGAFWSYIERTRTPIIAEFAYQNMVTREILYQWPEFEEALEICRMKKESELEKGALNGDFNASMSIFSLKQMGWKDTHESTLKGDPKAPLALILNGSDVDG